MFMKNVKEFYDKTASGWSDDYLKEKENKDIIRKFVDCFVNGGTLYPRILDLGCGAGYDSKILNELGAKTVGVDISENLIEIAKENLPNSKFFVGDISDNLTSLGKFDGVLCLATIMHIDIEKMKQTFNNIADVLNEGGLLLISAFDGVGKNIKKSLVKFENETFDQNFNNYDAESICTFAHPRLKLVDTWKFDDFDEGWRYYIFVKIDDELIDNNK